MNLSQIKVISHPCLGFWIQTKCNQEDTAESSKHWNALDLRMQPLEFNFAQLCCKLNWPYTDVKISTFLLQMGFKKQDWPDLGICSLREGDESWTFTDDQSKVVLVLEDILGNDSEPSLSSGFKAGLLTLSDLIRWAPTRNTLLCTQVLNQEKGSIGCTRKKLVWVSDLLTKFRAEISGRELQMPWKSGTVCGWLHHHDFFTNFEINVENLFSKQALASA